MTFENFVKNFKKMLDYNKVGMVLFHNGIVRGTSRNGNKVNKIKVKVNFNKIDNIIKEFSNKKGIFKVDVFAFQGEFQAGDNLLFVAVAGDYRENVFPVLEQLVNRIKIEAVEKIEF